MELILDLKKFNNYLRGDKYESTISELKEKIIKDVDAAKEKFEDNIPVGNYLTLLLLAKPFHDFDEEYTEEFLVNPVDVDGYPEYLDRVIDHFITNLNIPNRDLCLSIAYTIDELTIFTSKHVLMDIGPSISLYDLYKVTTRNEEFMDNLRFSTVNMNNEDNFQEIIDNYQTNNLNEIIDIILKDPKNSYKTLLKSKSGININQLNEVIGWIGYKPDLFGNVIPNPIDTSFMRGLNNPNEFLINAIAARKALITTKSEVRKSGYLTRRISILTGDIVLSEVDDCGSKHYLHKYIKDKDTLSFYYDRYYINDNGEEELIYKGTHEHLIGRNIKLRSPITCALPEEKLCKRCYGLSLSRINKNLGVGTIATLLLTNPMTQKLLSTKHLQRVVIKNFDWDDKFSEFLKIEGYEIKPDEPRTTIVIYPEDLQEQSELDYNRYSVERFFIKASKAKNGVEHEVNSPTKLNIPDRVIDDIDSLYNPDKDYYEFDISDLGSDSLFTIQVRNTGIADPLLNIKSMLERKAFIEEVAMGHNYHMMMDRFIELLIESGTFIRSVHMEVILRNMVFLNDDYKERVNYRDERYVPNLTIKTVNQSIYENPSPIKSIMFEQVLKQLTTDSFNDLFNKNDTSMFDRLFDIH